MSSTWARYRVVSEPPFALSKEVISKFIWTATCPFRWFIITSSVRWQATFVPSWKVDGEPWIQPAGDIVVLKSALKVRFDIIRGMPRFISILVDDGGNEIKSQFPFEKTSDISSAEVDNTKETISPIFAKFTQFYGHSRSRCPTLHGESSTTTFTIIV